MLPGHKAPITTFRLGANILDSNCRVQIACVALWLATAFLAAHGDVTLRPLSVTYIPYDYTPEARHAMFTEASEQIAHDEINHITYTIGEGLKYSMTIVYVAFMLL